MRYPFLTFIILLLLTACKEDKTAEQPIIEVEKEITEVAKRKKVTVRLKDESEGTSGTAVFKENNGTVIMTSVIYKHQEGTHNINLYDKREGEVSGDLIDYTLWRSVDSEKIGEIGTIEVDANGNGVITFSQEEWCIECDDTTKSILGKTILITQGNHITCSGVIK